MKQFQEKIHMSNNLNEISRLIKNSQGELLTKKLTQFIGKNAESIKLHKHPLGFFSAVLGQPSPKTKIRLHIWDHSINKQDDQLKIHNHIFNLKSFVLIGQITNVNYTVKTNKNSMGYLFKVHYEDNISKLRIFKNNINLVLNEKKDVLQSSFYTIPQGQYHESKVKTNMFTATVVKADYKSIKEPLVYSLKPSIDSIKYIRSEIDELERDRIINKLLVEMKKVHNKQ